VKFDSERAKEAGKKSSRAGRPNKATADLRQFIADALENGTGQLLKDLAELEPKDRVNAWLKLAEFVLPKLTRAQTEISGPDGGPLATIIQFIDDSKDADNINKKDV
jgi:hypothetical protein